MTTQNNQRGISILGVLFWGVVLMFVLSYFNISIKAVVESPVAQENLDYVESGTRNLWSEYLKEPASYLWNDIWIDIFWKSFVNNMERIRDGKPTEIDEAGNNLKVRY